MTDTVDTAANASDLPNPVRFEGIVEAAMAPGREVILSVVGNRTFGGRRAVRQWRELGGKRVRVTLEVLG